MKGYKVLQLYNISYSHINIRYKNIHNNKYLQNTYEIRNIVFSCFCVDKGETGDMMIFLIFISAAACATILILNFFENALTT